MATTPDIKLRVVLDASSALKSIDRARMAMLPASVIADLSGMVARWRLERGLSDEPASAVDLAMMILSLPGIGQATLDAYLKGTGVIVRRLAPADELIGTPAHFTLAAVDPTRVEVRDAAEEPEQDGEDGQGGREAEGRRDEARRPD